MSKVRQNLGIASYAIAGLATLLMVVVDSRQHFDSKLVVLKKKHHSAQRNWNVYFDQSNVYYSGGFRYVNDFKNLEAIITNGSAVFGDLPTSYYLASYLPSYVKNVHGHHGRHKSPEWHRFIAKRIGCYVDMPENMKKFRTLLAREDDLASKRNLPRVKYMIVNRDVKNINLRRDCFVRRAGKLSSTLGEYATQVYQGEMLSVFRLP